MMTKVKNVFGLVVVMVVLVGCKNQPPLDEIAPSNAQSGNTAAELLPTKADVANIVFVGKKDACACTQERIKLTWEAMQTALGSPPKVLVERINVDSDAAKVKPYQEMEATMVLPGLYFLDEAGILVEMLQGELSAEEIAKVLGWVDVSQSESP